MSNEINTTDEYIEIGSEWEKKDSDNFTVEVVNLNQDEIKFKTVIGTEWTCKIDRFKILYKRKENPNYKPTNEKSSEVEQNEMEWYLLTKQEDIGVDSDIWVSLMEIYNKLLAEKEGLESESEFFKKECDRFGDEAISFEIYKEHSVYLEDLTPEERQQVKGYVQKLREKDRQLEEAMDLADKFIKRTESVLQALYEDGSEEGHSEFFYRMNSKEQVLHEGFLRKLKQLKEKGDGSNKE